MSQQRRAALISLGCPKNLSDSEDLVTSLRSVGIGLTDDIQEAAVILINTCGFIQDAKQESIAHIFEALEARSAGAIVIVAGCLTERYVSELQQEIPEVDYWLAFDDYPQLPALLHQVFPDLPQHHLRHDQRSQLTPPHFAYLKIAEGCDNSCNFCAIPLFRGRHISRPESEILEQARILGERGVQEINLISQHLDYYGVDLHQESRLPELLQGLSRAAPEAWLRLHYCYPNGFSDRLIDTMAALPGVLHYIDMPLQHASDRILAAMDRRCTRAFIEQRIARIREAMPDAVIRASFILGFPGEREQDFKELLEFIAEQRFDHAACFAYSDEDGTTAARMPNKLAENIIEQRCEQFMHSQKAILDADLAQRWIGRELEVLVDEQVDFDRFHCRHYGQAYEVDTVTIIDQPLLECGSRIRARISDIADYDLVARVCF